jgi:hypothetical protein
MKQKKSKKKASKVVLLQKSDRVSVYTKKINPNHIKIIKEKAFSKKESIQQIIN